MQKNIRVKNFISSFKSCTYACGDDVFSCKQPFRRNKALQPLKALTSSLNLSFLFLHFTLSFSLHNFFDNIDSSLRRYFIYLKTFLISMWTYRHHFYFWHHRDNWTFEIKSVLHFLFSLYHRQCPLKSEICFCVFIARWSYESVNIYAWFFFWLPQTTKVINQHRLCPFV